MTTRELIKRLLDCNLDAKISIDTSFSDALIEDEGMDIESVEPDSGHRRSRFTIITLFKT